MEQLDGVSVIGDDGVKRPKTIDDDPYLSAVRDTAPMTVHAPAGPRASTLYGCQGCGRGARGDMLVSLGGKWICDGCWTAVRRRDGGISEVAARHDPAMPPPAEAGGSEQG